MSVIFFIIDILLWTIVSFNEKNYSIISIHLLFLLVCLSIFKISSRDKRLNNTFSFALLIRGVFTVLAWYLASDIERMFYVGTNMDSSFFWEAANNSYEDALTSFEDPLFPLMNVLVSDVSRLIDYPSYLSAMQVSLFSGAIFVSVIYAFTKKLYGIGVGNIAGYLMAISPTAIAFSTGLLRDSTIGLIGFSFLLAILIIQEQRQLIKKICLIFFALICSISLMFLRSISCAGFAVAGVLLIFSPTNYNNLIYSKLFKLMIIIFISIIVGLAVYHRFDRFDGMFGYANAIREGVDYGIKMGDPLNPDGITTKIANITPLLFIFISPYTIVQPFPFFSWAPPEFMGGEVAIIDVLIGIGGLFNQILLGLYLLAIYRWIKCRDKFGIRIGLAFTIATSTIILIGLGQIRMMLSHIYPFYLIGVSLILYNHKFDLRNFIIKYCYIWLPLLLALYIFYFLYKLI